MFRPPVIRRGPIDPRSLNPSMGILDLQRELSENVFFSADYFAEEITIAPAASDPVTLYADVGEAEVSRQEDGRGVQMKVTHRTITFSTDSGAACGGYSDTDGLLNAKVTYPASGGADYAVEPPVHVRETTKTAQVRIVRSEKIGAERPGLRKDNVSW